MIATPDGSGAGLPALEYPLPEPAIEGVVDALAFNADGLVTAVAQQHDTGEVLMLAWMNAEAVRATLRSGRVTYWSRSRQRLWQKGDTSGHVQWLKVFRYDCDADAVLVLVDQVGAACHTGRRTCFFNEARPGGVAVISDLLA